jgi:plastocyanin
MKTACPLLTLFVLTITNFQAATSVMVRDSKGNPVADAVVSLLPLDATPDLTPGANAVIAQDDKEYDPYVTPLVVGTRVSFPNRDSIQHHIYSLSRAKRFEKPLYGSGSEESVIFDQPGVVVLGCNIHDWMIAYVLVLNTPHFAKSDADGRATIASPPPGRYRLEVWHPRISRTETRDLVIAATPAPVIDLTITLKPDRRIRRAPESKTGGY